MRTLKTGNHTIQIQQRPFLSAVPKKGGTTWVCETPFVLRVWSVPEERERVYADCETRILEAYETARGLRLRLELGLPRDAWFRIEMEIEPIEDGFALRLSPETLVENKPHWHRLMELEVLPEFMSGAASSSGYLLLPNYCGGLVTFSDGPEFEARDMVYMEQSRWEHWPTMALCGIKRDGEAWLAVLSEGQFDARIVSRRVRRDNVSTHVVTPSFVFRHNKKDRPVPGPKEVHYHFLQGNDADYNGMARAYRRHLLDVRGLRPLRDRIRENPGLAYTARSYHVKIFHGMKLNCLPDGEESMTVMTTFEEAATIAKRMKSSGVEECVSVLTGWNPEGHDGMWPTRFPVEARLGGDAGFVKLLQEMKDLGHLPSVHDNHVGGSRRSPLFDTVDHVVDRDGEWNGGADWGGGTDYRQCPGTMPRTKSLLDFQRMKNLGVTGFCYLDNMPQPLYQCFHPDHPVGRREYAEGLRRLAQSARDVFGAIGVETCLDYMAGAVDLVWIAHPPLREVIHGGAAGVPHIDQLVPFYQIAFHGILLYHSDYGYRFRQRGWSVDKAIALDAALGALPVNELAFRQGWYIPGYEGELETMAAQYKALCGERAGLQTVFIDSIQMDAELGLFETTYEDGTTTFVDLSKETWRVER